jgi:DNA-binding HxlR family transcriptional regulator
VALMACRLPEHRSTLRGSRPRTRSQPHEEAGMNEDIARSAALVQLLAGRWTLAVLAELSKGGRRYQDLHDALDGISFKVLTDTLRRAERDGLITRHLDPGRIETATLYELTDLGRSIDAPLQAMADWAITNLPSVETARQRWDQLRRESR